VEAFPKDIQERFKDYGNVPLKRVGEHQELANLAAFLMSDFSSFINGEVVTIDGGEWINGAGEFNFLTMFNNGTWDMIESVIKGKTK
jgi:NAD(P)-dependent dehydrogenase (short-subunit alcohol dehydrogenase family)